jgi:hypothetical protein
MGVVNPTYLNTPEPAPIAGAEQAVWELVEEDVKMRFPDGPVRAKFLTFARRRDPGSRRSDGVPSAGA